MPGPVHMILHLIHTSNVDIIPIDLFEVKGDQDINYPWKVIQLSGGIRPEPRISELESLVRNCITSKQIVRSFLFIQNTHYVVVLVKPLVQTHNPISITNIPKYLILTSKQRFQRPILMMIKEDYLQILQLHGNPSCIFRVVGGGGSSI